VALGLARIFTLIVLLGSQLVGLVAPSSDLLSPFGASVAQAQVFNDN